MAEKKDKQYVSDNAQLMAEWDWALNSELDPAALTYGSNRTASWICDKGHRWNATIADRTRGRNCPYCSGRRILEGTNDLATTNPELIPQWHPTKNGELTPQKVSAGSNKKVWWLCKEGHEWQTYVYTRAKGIGCPLCAQVLRVKNNSRNQIEAKGSLATNFPELTKEWDDIQNGTLTPKDVLCGSTKKVWWRCSKGHSWEARISHRVSGVGCPVCAQATQSSFPEQAILFYLKQFTDVKHRYVHNGFEMDIYLPAYQIGIEYDGVYYHKGEKSLLREQKKDSALLAEGITVIRVKETWKLEDAISKNENIIYCVPTSGNTHMNKAIVLLANRLSQMTGLECSGLDVDVQRDQIDIRSQLLQYEKEHSALAVDPDLQNEFHPTKNGQLTLEHVSAFSSQKLWWLCRTCGTEWQSNVANRVKGSGCPKCSLGIRTQKRNATLLSMSGTLLEQNATLAKEWHPTKNGTLTPDMVTPVSGKKVWWMCSQGHEWEALISNRAKGSGCPYCAGQRAVAGYNDLMTTHPALVAEWDFKKNSDITPKEVMGGSNKKVWWKCANGHKWQARIVDRTQGNGCPICAGKKRK